MPPFFCVCVWERRKNVAYVHVCLLFYFCRKKLKWESFPMGSRWEGVRDRREWEASLRTSFNMLGIVLLGPFQWTQPGSIFQNGVLRWVPLIKIEHCPHSPIPCLLLPSPHWETIPQNIAAFIHLLCTIKNFRITISISPLTSLWNKGFNIFCIFKKVLEYMPQCVSIRNAVFKNHFKQLSFICSCHCLYYNTVPVVRGCPLSNILFC